METRRCAKKSCYFRLWNLLTGLWSIKMIFMSIKNMLTLYLSLRILFLNCKLLLCFGPPNQDHNFSHGDGYLSFSCSWSEVSPQIPSSTFSLPNTRDGHPHWKERVTFLLMTSSYNKFLTKNSDKFYYIIEPKHWYSFENKINKVKGKKYHYHISCLFFLSSVIQLKHLNWIG